MFRNAYLNFADGHMPVVITVALPVKLFHSYIGSELFMFIIAFVIQVKVLFYSSVELFIFGFKVQSAGCTMLSNLYFSYSNLYSASIFSEFNTL